MRHAPHRSARDLRSPVKRRAAAAVEFALVAPFLLLLLAGIIEFGQSFFIQHSPSTSPSMARPMET
ncbi:MAG: TadE/TadG family type IV pilus assembly protein [Planctomycetaceae bacterium]